MRRSISMRTMKKFTVLFIYLIPLIGFSQTDVLILQKNGRNIETYAPGMPIMLHTVYDQWLEGTITDMRNDSVYINNNPFHVQEINAIRKNFSKLHLQAGGTVLIVAGVGVLVLNVINGLYTNEPAGQWIKASGWIVAGAFIITGLIMKSARFTTYKIGKKYSLHYLNLRAGNPSGESHSMLNSEPPKQPDAH
jgi:hypothetical protein